MKISHFKTPGTYQQCKECPYKTELIIDKFQLQTKIEKFIYSTQAIIYYNIVNLIFQYGLTYFGIHY